MALTTVGQMERDAELRGRQEDARKMEKKGYPIDDVMEITGLSREELQVAGLFKS